MAIKTLFQLPGFKNWSSSMIKLDLSVATCLRMTSYANPFS